MDFTNVISDLARRSQQAVEKALTEEATKTSVILPFIKAMGFDPFSLDEVVPEFVSDVGIKKGEKVDFALKIDGKPEILIEVKPVSMSLGNAQFSQLYRYFGVTDAKLAILTNGKEFWFFSDTDETNKMDKKPFFKFDLSKYDKDELTELSRFRKEGFSIENILEAASNLKYTNAAVNYLKTQLENPDDDFTRLVGKQIYEGSLTKAAMELVRPAIQAALDIVIRERIQDKLGITFQSGPANEPVTQKKDAEVEESEIVTTEEEIQAFMIVRAICASTIDIKRITIRDAKSYCSVFIDDNNRKPLIRLYFNAKSKISVGVFDSDKIETKSDIERLEDIYRFADVLRDTAKSYA